MDTLDAITLLYLSKNWDGQGSLLDCAHMFQQTKSKLADALHSEEIESLNKRMNDSNFTF